MLLLHYYDRFLIIFIFSKHCDEIQANDDLINTRNFILCKLFSKPEGILISDIYKISPVSAQDIKEIMIRICKPISVEFTEEDGSITQRKLWRLKVDRDVDWSKRFPEVAERAKKTFETMTRTLEKVFIKSECMQIFFNLFSPIFNFSYLSSSFGSIFCRSFCKIWCLQLFIITY